MRDCGCGNGEMCRSHNTDRDRARMRRCDFEMAPVAHAARSGGAPGGDTGEDVTWRRPRIERCADGTTLLYFGIGSLSWRRKNAPLSSELDELTPRPSVPSSPPTSEEQG